ncbi:Alcohol dehydrogenase superfamily, zinc-type [Metarhizium album ARSEF 1941]|uniref:Dehydrogenase FUB6 n=1 Tax=Metarhizium album (strain ARSEF 1941) TaxID=1081103 RepID=A0A0B2WSR6_METAS|nr:Alcohol dehydrogenase superfamily, zinc-type [Metarhizium album ARSEF 1941]KHN97078.1 Alcohol dehydrogenase superfamily, zinc-type [Metarhizium album ARSEF 1941]
MDNVRVVLNARPADKIIPGETFRKETGLAPCPKDLEDGQILFEVLLISLEPAMRGWLSEALTPRAHSEKRSYLPPVQIGETMRSFSAARVLATRSKQAEIGDVVVAASGWARYAIVREGLFEPASTLPEVAETHELLSTYGLTGMTAWVGMTVIGEPKPGETVVVSAAAGATGSMAGQMAKIKGARVIGICGGEEKCNHVREVLGFDVALDYKAPDFKDKFMEATGDFIDVYFDNVGGEILDMALGQAKKGARLVQCGLISQYNREREQPSLKNYFNVISMRVKIQGFIVTDHMDLWPQARQEIAQWVGQGKLTSAVSIVEGGLDVVDKTLASLYNGSNTGKLLVKVKDVSDPPAEL